MTFEWDEDKAMENEAKHDGVSFYDAIAAINDFHSIDFYDAGHSIEEHRYNLIGLSQRGLLYVVFTIPATDTLRIIFARLAEPDEKRIYEEKLLEEEGHFPQE